MSETILNLLWDHVPAASTTPSDESYLDCSCGWEQDDKIGWMEHMGAALVTLAPTPPDALEYGGALYNAPTPHDALDVERWYRAFATVSGLEAATPEGRRDIYDMFAAALAEKVRDEVP